MTQTQVAEAMSASQPAAVRIEKSSDTRVSTLRRYVEALGRAIGRGARLEVAAVIGEDRYVISFPVRRELASVGRRRDEEPIDGQSAWRLRAWGDPDLEQQMLDRGIVAMTEDEFGDLTDWPGDQEMRSQIESVFPTTGPQGGGLRLRYLKDFRFNMAPGDVVVVPLAGRRVGVATVVTPYEYVGDEPEARLRHRHGVRWDWVGSRDRLPKDIVQTINAPGTICAIKAPDAHGRLEEFSRGSATH